MTTTDPARSDSSPRAFEGDLRDIISATLRRWPSAGVAVAVVRDGSTVRYFCHGIADIASGRRVSEGTVFRVGSLTKTVTAVAVMQLCEQGMVDLDAPANDYLRGSSWSRLTPASGPRQCATCSRTRLVWAFGGGGQTCSITLAWALASRP